MGFVVRYIYLWPRYACFAVCVLGGVMNAALKYKGKAAIGIYI